jgi:hypothetical protein
VLDSPGSPIDALHVIEYASDVVSFESRKSIRLDW